MRHYYVYKVTDPATGEYYFGARMSVLPPERDAGYFGNGEWPKRALIDQRVLGKAILSIHETWNAALDEEAALIARYKWAPLNRNYKPVNCKRIPMQLDHISS
jgi:hypothetical protein